MTTHNALTRAPWSKATQAALGVQKTDGGVERYGETMQPVLDLWSLPEWAILRDEILWGKKVFVAPVAAEFGFVAIANPPNSRRVVVVTAAAGANAVAGGTLIASTTTYAAVVAAGANTFVAMRDIRAARGGAQQLNVPEVWFGEAVATLIAGGFQLEERTSVAVNQFVDFTCAVPFIVPPSFAFYVQSPIANQGVHVSFAGSVRLGLPGELVS